MTQVQPGTRLKEGTFNSVRLWVLPEKNFCVMISISDQQRVTELSIGYIPYTDQIVWVGMLGLYLPRLSEILRSLLPGWMPSVVRVLATRELMNISLVESQVHVFNTILYPLAQALTHEDPYKNSPSTQALQLMQQGTQSRLILVCWYQINPLVLVVSQGTVKTGAF